MTTKEERTKWEEKGVVGKFDLLRLIADCNSLEHRVDRLEQFLLFLGDLCDSPDSLRRHLAGACEDVYRDRQARGQEYPRYEGYWREFLPKKEGSG